MNYYKFLEWGIVIIVVLLLWQLGNLFIGTKLFKLLLKGLRFVSNSISTSLGLTAGRYQDYIDIMNSYRRERNIIYKYHYTMNVAIESLGLRNHTNVQTISFYIVILSFVLSVVFTIGINTLLTMFLFVILLLFFHLFLVFLSRSMTIKRSIALMDAEDTLCTGMEDGIQVALDRNIKMFDPLVRYMFEELQLDISLKTPMGTALDSLNTKAGKQFDSFCQTALNHYRDNDPVSLTTFSENIKRNSKKRIAIAEQQANYKKALGYYGIAMCGIAIFSFAMVGILGAGASYLLTTHGRTCTILSVAMALVGFIASQIIFSGGVD